MRRLLFLALMLAPAPASAACASLAASGLSFGTYSGLAVTNSAATVTLNGCTASFGYSVGLNAGTGMGATTTTRKLTSGANTLNYQMFQDAAATTNWGNAQNVDTRTGNTGQATSVPLNVYARLLSLQYPAPGAYTDTITATGLNSGNITTTFSVSATVSPTCTLSATLLDFGAYSGALTSGTSTITVTCTSTTPWYVNLSNGAQPLCCWSNNMQGGSGAYLNYLLYQDPAHTVLWQNMVNVNGAPGTGTGTGQTLTVYGAIAAGQFVAPGLYSDTVIATVTY